MTNASTTRKTKKTVVDTPPLPDQNQDIRVMILSIAFDKNGNLYGTSTSGKLYLFNFDTKTWGLL